MATLPERKAVDPPQEFWFRRPGVNDPIQEVVPVKHAEELVAKGWELLSVGPRAEAPAPSFREFTQGAALATGAQE